MKEQQLIKRLDEIRNKLPASATEISLSQRYAMYGETPKLWVDAIDCRRLLEELIAELLPKKQEEGTDHA